MKHRLTILAALYLASLSPLHAAGNSSPNVVILLADDLRPDGLDSLGNPIVKTQHVDKLVSSGFIFRRAYVMGAMTPQGAGQLRVQRKPAVLPAEHVVGRIDVEESPPLEPAHDPTAHLLGERRQTAWAIGHTGSKVRRPVAGRHEDAVSHTQVERHIVAERRAEAMQEVGMGRGAAILVER